MCSRSGLWGLPKSQRIIFSLRNRFTKTHHRSTQLKKNVENQESSSWMLSNALKRTSHDSLIALDENARSKRQHICDFENPICTCQTTVIHNRMSHSCHSSSKEIFRLEKCRTLDKVLGGYQPSLSAIERIHGHGETDNSDPIQSSCTSSGKVFSADLPWTSTSSRETRKAVHRDGFSSYSICLCPFGRACSCTSLPPSPVHASRDLPYQVQIESCCTENAETNRYVGVGVLIDILTDLGTSEVAGGVGDKLIQQGGHERVTDDELSFLLKYTHVIGGTYP